MGRLWKALEGDPRPEVRQRKFTPPALIYTPFDATSREMSWREIWDVFADRYPGQWAAQMFPSASELVDEADVYHLLVLAEDRVGVTIRRRD